MEPRVRLGYMPQPRCHQCERVLPKDQGNYCAFCGVALNQGMAIPKGLRSRRWVTVLFADIVGFTSLSEIHEPDEIGSLLDNILEPLTSIILEENGIIDKYIGDAIMALFGAHTSSHNDASNAIKAALRMQEKITQLSHHFEKDFGVGIQLRVGINTGKVLAGPIGAAQYRKFTVLGDAVNLASRLESACEPGRVLVGANTQRFAHDEFEMESGGLISVKGKAKKIAAYYPLYPKQRTTIEVTEHFNGVSIPFLGRDEELKAIISEYKKRCNESETAVINISGVDSIGKSRLILKSIERMYAGQIDIIYHETGHTTLEFLKSFSHPIRALVLKRYDSIEAFIRTLQGEALRVAGRRTLISTEILYRFLIDTTDETQENTDTNNEEQIQLLRAIVLALNHLHKHSNVAIWVRLNERIDHDLSRFLEYVTDSNSLTSSLPIFLEDTRTAGTDRLPDDHESSFSNIIIQVEPMNDRVIRALTHSLLQTAGGAPEWLSIWLAEASSGRPGFVLEYLDHLVSEEIIRIDASLGDWTVAAEKPENVVLPASINILLQTELDHLTKTERHILSCAALLDRPFLKSDVASVTDTNLEDIETTIQNFLSKKLLLRSMQNEEGQGYQFRNSSLRQVAEDSLTFDVRRKTHCKISEYLTQNKADPALIAAHYLQGQAWGKALSFTLEAIHIATASFALQRASAYLSQARFLFEEAQDELSPGEEILANLQFNLVQAEIAFYNGDTTEAKDGLDVVLNACNHYKTAQSDQTPEFKHSLLRLSALATKLGGHLSARLGQHSDAIEFFEQALQDLCTLHRPASEVCSIEASISWALLQLGEIDEAKLRSELALESMQLQLSPPPLMRDAWARHYDTLGNIAMNRQELQNAHALFLAAQALRRINGSVSLLAHSEGNIAAILALKGEWESSAQAFERVANQWAALGNGEMECIGRLNLIECLLELTTPIDSKRREQLESLIEHCDRLLEPLRSPHLEGILAGHRERALSAFAAI